MQALFLQKSVRNVRLWILMDNRIRHVDKLVTALQAAAPYPHGRGIPVITQSSTALLLVLFWVRAQRGEDPGTGIFFFLKNHP